MWKRCFFAHKTSEIEAVILKYVDSYDTCSQVVRACYDYVDVKYIVDKIISD